MSSQKLSQKNQYRVQRKETVYRKGPIHVVDCDVRLKSGKDGRVLSRQILIHPGSVVIIPKIKNRFILIRQFRFATGGWLWEWPAGGVEKGETLKRAAARELREEIGLHPGRLKKMITFYPSPGVSSERMHLFLAEMLKKGKGTPDEDEDIEVRDFTLKEIGQMIAKGKIQDGKTILGYFWIKGKA